MQGQQTFQTLKAIQTILMNQKQKVQQQQLYTISKEDLDLVTQVEDLKFKKNKYFIDRPLEEFITQDPGYYTEDQLSYLLDKPEKEWLALKSRQLIPSFFGNKVYEQQVSAYHKDKYRRYLRYHSMKMAGARASPFVSTLDSSQKESLLRDVITNFNLYIELYHKKHNDFPDIAEFTSIKDLLFYYDDNVYENLQTIESLRQYCNPSITFLSVNLYLFQTYEDDYVTIAEKTKKELFSLYENLTDALRVYVRINTGSTFVGNNKSLRFAASLGDDSSVVPYYDKNSALHYVEFKKKLCDSSAQDVTTTTTFGPFHEVYETINRKEDATDSNVEFFYGTCSYLCILDQSTTLIPVLKTENLPFTIVDYSMYPVRMSVVEEGGGHPVVWNNYICFSFTETPSDLDIQSDFHQQDGGVTYYGNVNNTMGKEHHRDGKVLNIPFRFSNVQYVFVVDVNRYENKSYYGYQEINHGLQDLVESCVSNGTSFNIFGYGYSGTGKSYTLFGIPMDTIFDKIGGLFDAYIQHVTETLHIRNPHGMTPELAKRYLQAKVVFEGIPIFTPSSKDESTPYRYAFLHPSNTDHQQVKRHFDELVGYTEPSTSNAMYQDKYCLVDLFDDSKMDSIRSEFASVTVIPLPLYIIQKYLNDWILYDLWKRYTEYESIMQMDVSSSQPQTTRISRDHEDIQNRYLSILEREMDRIIENMKNAFFLIGNYNFFEGIQEGIDFTTLLITNKNLKSLFENSPTPGEIETTKIVIDEEGDVARLNSVLNFKMVEYFITSSTTKNNEDTIWQNTTISKGEYDSFHSAKKTRPCPVFVRNYIIQKHFFTEIEEDYLKQFNHWCTSPETLADLMKDQKDVQSIIETMMEISNVFKSSSVLIQKTDSQLQICKTFCEQYSRIQAKCDSIKSATHLPYIDTRRDLLDTSSTASRPKKKSSKGFVQHAIAEFEKRGCSVTVHDVLDVYGKFQWKDQTITLKSQVHRQPKKEGSSTTMMMSTLDEYLDQIETNRIQSRFIKPTPNNIRSSRSHLVLIFKVTIPYKQEPAYFSVIDMAGIENPYEIAEKTNAFNDTSDIIQCKQDLFSGKILTREVAFTRSTRVLPQEFTDMTEKKKTMRTSIIQRYDPSVLRTILDLQKERILLQPKAIITQKYLKEYRKTLCRWYFYKCMYNALTTNHTILGESSSSITIISSVEGTRSSSSSSWNRQVLPVSNNKNYTEYSSLQFTVEIKDSSSYSEELKFTQNTMLMLDLSQIPSRAEMTFPIADVPSLKDAVKRIPDPPSSFVDDNTLQSIMRKFHFKDILGQYRAENIDILALEMLGYPLFTWYGLDKKKIQAMDLIQKEMSPSEYDTYMKFQEPFSESTKAYLQLYSLRNSLFTVDEDKSYFTVNEDNRIFTSDTYTSSKKAIVEMITEIIEEGFFINESILHLKTYFEHKNTSDDDCDVFFPKVTPLSDEDLLSNYFMSKTSKEINSDRCLSPMETEYSSRTLNPLLTCRKDVSPPSSGKKTTDIILHCTTQDAHSSDIIFRNVQQHEDIVFPFEVTLPTTTPAESDSSSFILLNGYVYHADSKEYRHMPFYVRKEETTSFTGQACPLLAMQLNRSLVDEEGDYVFKPDQINMIPLLQYLERLNKNRGKIKNVMICLIKPDVTEQYCEGAEKGLTFGNSVSSATTVSSSTRKPSSSTIIHYLRSLIQRKKSTLMEKK